MVAPAAAVMTGLGISSWLIYLDYRRRIPPATPRRIRRPRWGMLKAGWGLAALGLGLRLITGTDRGWLALACYLPALLGMAMVAIQITRRLASAFHDEEETRRKRARR